MKVIETVTMPNGTDIQIEEWNETYNFMPYASKLATYPISKMSRGLYFGPRGGEYYRFSFDFENAEECKKAFDLLKEGKAQLKDYVKYMDRKEYADCI
jgi:hypothetical protein